MKNLIIIFGFLMFCQMTYAQKMVEQDKVWSHYVETFDITLPEPFLGSYTIVYSMGEEVMVDSMMYHKLRYNEWGFIEYNDSAQWSNTGYLVREDSIGRIYLNHDSIDERLIYDFSLEVDDEFFDVSNGFTYTLIEKDSMELENGEMAEVFIFDFDRRWIKGIGGETDFLSLHTSALICVKKEEELLIHNDFGGDFCFFIPVATHDIKDNSIELFPNPTFSNLVLESKEILINGVVNIYNLEGRIVHAQDIENQNTTTIKIDHLSAGMYYLRMNGFTKKIVKLN